MNNVNLDSKAVTNTCTLVSYAIVRRGLSEVLWKDCVMSQKNSGCGLPKDECYEFFPGNYEHEPGLQLSPVWSLQMNVVFVARQANDFVKQSGHENYGRDHAR